MRWREKLTPHYFTVTVRLQPKERKKHPTYLLLVCVKQALFVFCVNIKLKKICHQVLNSYFRMNNLLLNLQNETKKSGKDGTKNIEIVKNKSDDSFES